VLNISTLFWSGCSLRLGCEKYPESLNELKKYLDHAHKKNTKNREFFVNLIHKAISLGYFILLSSHL
jgi:hypothetical protein